MPTVTLSDALREQYQELFDTCDIKPGKASAVEAIVGRLERNQERYRPVADRLDAPWYFVGVIHNMESSMDFREHLHNGDPLTARTVQVPASSKPRARSGRASAFAPAAFFHADASFFSRWMASGCFASAAAPTCLPATAAISMRRTGESTLIATRATTR